MNRRIFIGKLSTIAMSIMTTGCVTTGLTPNILRNEKENSSGNEFYKSKTFGNEEVLNNTTNSEKSYAIFKSIRENNTIPNTLPIPSVNELEQAINMFQQTKTKYSTQNQLEINQTQEILDSLIPLMRMFVDVNNAEITDSLNIKKNTQKVSLSNSGTLTIPPGYIVSAKQQGYCLDAGLPAPGKGEVMTIAPITNLIPQELQPLYKAMQQKAYSNPSYRNEMQQLMWTLRSAGQEYGLASGVSRHTLSKMEEAMPNGSRDFLNYHQSELNTNKIKNQLGKLLNLNIGGININPMDLTDPNKQQKIMGDLLHRSLNTPVTGIMPSDNRNYQMLTPNVASFSIGASTLTPEIWIANTGNTPFNINFADYYMLPAREAQKIAMYPNTSDNISYREVSKDMSQKDKNQFEKTKNIVNNAVLGDVARFLNEKLLKNISKTKTFRDFALRNIKNTVAAKKIIDTMPILGNALSFWEFYSGKNWISGKRLNIFERVSAGFGAVPIGGVMKTAFKDKVATVGQAMFAGAGIALNQNVFSSDLNNELKNFNFKSYSDIETSLQEDMIKSVYEASQQNTPNITPEIRKECARMMQAYREKGISAFRVA